MRKLVIHAGIHRTGTTTIQNTLAKNRALLRNEGYLYPGDSINHQNWAWGILRGNKSPVDLLDFISFQLSDDIHTVILSAEDFCIHKNLSWLDTFSSAFNVQAKIYTRPQDEWLMSWYNQHVKWPWDPLKSRLTPSEFLQTADSFYWIDFDWLLSNWVDALGLNNVNAYPMTTDQAVAFFGEITPNIPVVFPKLNANESISPKAIDVLREINKIPQSIKLSATQRRKIIQLVKSFVRGSDATSIFLDEERLAIRERYAESNAIASDRYMGGKAIMGLDDKHGGSYTPLSDKEIISVVTRVMVQLGKLIR
jgi:hypothetical protein